MAQVMKDWNAPGIGVGIVVKDKLVFAKGYGYRDYGNKLPYTPTTTQPIASNSKLFTAVALGMLVEEGKLRWDEPIKRFVPAIRFYNDELDRSVTIRDMLSHRTGITRHDAIWYKSTFSRRELWDRLRYLEPAAPIRTTFLYNNLMYTAGGQVIEELSGLTWEQFVRRRIFDPLGMSRSTLTDRRQPQRTGAGRAVTPSAATARNSTSNRTTRRKSPSRRPARSTPACRTCPDGSSRCSTAASSMESR